ncbi:histidine kinase dimerization/phosphoacceptor domain -containing protein [Flavobacterium rakeshii]|uniref:tetratricopeptide repeat-containing sensor histidine kinase n=1 Tax=Flavobacterium rakeshii TaxID=1038845 RepID=UPI002E7ACFBF|nr:histidine kinase dimerization/phosphoacceptor domain -containing protein [Flavobacterium rakeshii]MEE1898421.1 histidine kinase dimerization/phosphoacceptor domain -containing protein [Flavobacterium rakeshii]
MVYKIVLILALLFPLKSVCQQTDDDEMRVLLKNLHYGEDNEEKAHNLLKVVKYYLNKENISKADIDSAALLNQKAMHISRELDLKNSIAQSMLFDSEITITKGDTVKGNELKNKALSFTKKHNLNKEAGSIYASLGYFAANTGDPNKIKHFINAASSYKQAGDFHNEAEMYCELSILFNSMDKPATSIKYALQAIEIKKKLKDSNLYQEYTILGMDYRVQGNYEDALSYALKAEKTMDNMEINGLWVSLLYDLLGTIYSELNFYDKSVEYYKKAIAVSKESNDTEGVTAITINTARSLYHRGKITEALEVLDSGFKFYHSTDCDVEYPSLYILIYCKLKQYNKAKPYYEQLIKCSNKVSERAHIEQEKMYYAIISYLTQTGQADKTYVYIDKLKELAKVHNDLFNLSQLERAHFESDSATGNYLGAIEHLKNQKKLDDSLFNINSTKQFADLQLKYETEKKDKNIKLLTQQSQLQQTKLEHEMVIRYIFIASLAISFIILGLLYSRYCIKRKSNAVLEAKQEEINRKNKKLQNLVEEKEWLLKEIHHRVKNNLQIVISLLNTQSAYLENEDALLAIQNSQHRMHAMSLIHQKLYQTDNLSSINISWYIQELASYLKDSFDDENKIRFELNTQSVELDVAQAVPLGLILNEAISNAIKYAFPQQKGIISITFKETQENTFLLQITDNGIGLPEGFEPTELDSLGMNLMTGLAEQLDGTFNITTNNGVTITITFIKRVADV